MHDVKSYYLKSNNLNTEEQPAIVPKKGSKDSLAGGQPDGFYVSGGLGSVGLGRARVFPRVQLGVYVLKPSI